MTDKELQEIIQKKVEYQHKKHIQRTVKKERILSKEDYEKLEGTVSVGLKECIEQELIDSIQECNDSIKEIQKGITAIQEIDIKQCSDLELINVTGVIVCINATLEIAVKLLNT